MRKKKQTTETYITIVSCKYGHFERYVKSKSCVECNAINTKKYQSNRILVLSPEKREEHNFKIRQRTESAAGNGIGCHSPVRLIYKWAKARAKRRSLEFNIDVSDIVIPKYCPVFPEIELSRNKGKVSYNSPTLDRVDNNKGYVKGNIKIISNKANMLKRNGTIYEFKRLIEYMESNPQEKN
jgi:hypothetical protein